MFWSAEVLARTAHTAAETLDVPLNETKERADGCAVKPIHALTAVRGNADEPAPFKSPEVVRNPALLNIERPDDRADRLWSSTEVLDDRPPCGIPHRLEEEPIGGIRVRGVWTASHSGGTARKYETFFILHCMPFLSTVQVGCG